MNDEPVTVRHRSAADRRRMAMLVAIGLAVSAAIAALMTFAATSRSAVARSAVEPCARLAEQGGSTPPAHNPTTITTVQQVYDCIFEHQYSAEWLDHRQLLVTAFRHLTAELQRRGQDQASATLPAFTGDRERDWAAFAGRYQSVMATLPNDAQLRQALAVAAIDGLLEALHTNHVEWTGARGVTGPRSAFGFEVTFEGLPTVDVPPKDIRDARGPMYVTTVTPDSPAGAAGLKAGDIVKAVNDVPVFVAGTLTPGVLQLLNPPHDPTAGSSDEKPVTITIQRPATGETSTLQLQGSAPPTDPPSPEAKLLDNGVAYVTVPSFYETAEAVLSKITALDAGNALRGVIIDVRGNGGGRAETVAGLLGAFAHEKVWGWSCDNRDRCTPSRTDDSVALLHVPLVVLTDGRCASACDAFSAAVKDLDLGKLVGARTAGIVAGTPEGYRLNDGNMVSLLPRYFVAPSKEIVDGVGVAVDYQAPLTARDLSTGRDPGLAKALSLLSK